MSNANHDIAAIESGAVPVPVEAHAANHEYGGTDQLNVSGLSGALADPQLPLIGSTSTTAVAGNDSRLTNARTPTAHAGSHALNGADPIKLDDLAAPDDNTDLDASTAKHGLMKKFPGGTSNFLRSDGAFAAPTATVAITSVPLDFGPVPTRAAAIVVTDASITPSSKIIGVINDASDAEENSGNMDPLGLTFRPAAGSFTVFAEAPCLVRGVFQLCYQAAA